MLQNLLRETLGVYALAHLYHFNVQGPSFPQYHMLLDSIYKDLQESIDPLGENIRKQGDLVDPTSFTIAPPPAKTTAEEQLRDLQDRLHEYFFSLEKTIQAYDKPSSQGLLNFLAERQDRVADHLWRLYATTKR